MSFNSPFNLSSNVDGLYFRFLDHRSKMRARNAYLECTEVMDKVCNETKI
jgi:hypothetical protein